MKKSVLFLAVVTSLSLSSCFPGCLSHKEKEDINLKNGGSLCEECKREMMKRVSDRIKPTASTTEDKDHNKDQMPLE